MEEATCESQVPLTEYWQSNPPTSHPADWCAAVGVEEGMDLRLASFGSLASFCSLEVMAFEECSVPGSSFPPGV